MSNPFHDHGIYNVSPSQCNLFVAAPAMWVMERLLKRKSVMGVPAHAGTAVEAGIVAGLKQPGLLNEVCVEVALREFSKLTALSGDPRKEKYDAAIPKMVEQGITHLRPYGAPSSTQGKVERQIDGLAVPMIGYYDLKWDDSGVLTDIKTTLRMPSEIKLSHARQVAFYKHGISDNLDARVTYITDKKAETLLLEDSRAHLNSLERIALIMQRFLALSKDPHELAQLICPDYESFYWNDNTARAHALEVWGF